MYKPTVALVRSAAGPQGYFSSTPKGVIQHGSRSGQPYDTAEEYMHTLGWAANPDNVYGWNLTVGDDEYAEHVASDAWGWNAFRASEVYLAAEYAQAGANGQFEPISDAQVRAFCCWFATDARAVWPDLPLHFPTHSEVEHSGEIQHMPSGKTDVFPYADRRADELRMRILARLKTEYGIVA